MDEVRQSVDRLGLRRAGRWLPGAELEIGDHLGENAGGTR